MGLPMLQEQAMQPPAAAYDPNYEMVFTVSRATPGGGEANSTFDPSISLMGKPEDYVTLDGFTFDTAKDITDAAFQERFSKDTYEKEERTLLAKHLPATAQVLELGACLGVMGVITNSKLSDKGKHCVVEANPTLVPYINKNKEINGAGFNIIHGLVSKTSSGEFTYYKKPVAGSAHRRDNREGEGTKTKVEVYTVESIQQKYGYTPDTLIVDIEGGELEFFEQNIDFIGNNIKLILVECHEFLMNEPGFNQKIVDLLATKGFKVVDKEDINFLFKKE